MNSYNNKNHDKNGNKRNYTFKKITSKYLGFDLIVISLVSFIFSV